MCDFNVQFLTRTRTLNWAASFANCVDSQIACTIIMSTVSDILGGLQLIGNVFWGRPYHIDGSSERWL